MHEMASKDLVHRTILPPGAPTRRQSTVSTIGSISSSTVSPISPSLDAASVKSGKTSAEVYLFLEQRVTGGCLPRFQHGFDAFSSVAYCLVNVTESKYGELKTRSFDPAQGTVLLNGGDRTLRQEVETCRAKCTDILSRLSNDMSEVSAMGLRISAEDGPVRFYPGVVPPVASPRQGLQPVTDNMPARLPRLWTKPAAPNPIRPR
jgi:hypothetical protein